VRATGRTTFPPPFAGHQARNRQLAGNFVGSDRLNGVPIEKGARPAQAACSYSCRTRPSRSRRRMISRASRSGLLIGSGNGLQRRGVGDALVGARGGLRMVANAAAAAHSTPLPRKVLLAFTGARSPRAPSACGAGRVRPATTTITAHIGGSAGSRRTAASIPAVPIRLGFHASSGPRAGPTVWPETSITRPAGTPPRSEARSGRRSC
jgi:hypothetical protein